MSPSKSKRRAQHPNLPSNDTGAALPTHATINKTARGINEEEAAAAALLMGGWQQADEFGLEDGKPSAESDTFFSLSHLSQSSPRNSQQVNSNDHCAEAGHSPDYTVLNLSDLGSPSPVSEKPVAENKRRKTSRPKVEPFTVKGEPVSTPHANDVLLGRGKAILDHAGNRRFRNFVREKKENYLINSWKYEKSELACQVLERVASLTPPGRFLRLSPDGLWRDADETACLEKALQGLREKKWTHPVNVTLKEVVTNTTKDINWVIHRKPIAKACGLLPGHPNEDYSAEDIQMRIRTGARISVFVPEMDSYVSGKVIKRLAARVQIQTAEGATRTIDLNKEKIRIDSRKLNPRRRRNQEENEGPTLSHYGGSQAYEDRPNPRSPF